MKQVILSLIIFLITGNIFGDVNFDLTAAARWGKLDQINELLTKGANINFQDHYGRTPIMIAASQGHLDVLRFLIQKGANLKIKDRSGSGILDFSSYEARVYLIEKKIVPIPKKEKRCHKMVMELYKMNVHSVNSGFSNQANQFNEVYKITGKKNYFETCLRVYLRKDLDKHYSVGMFLFMPEYGNLKEYRMAEVILKRGLKLAEMNQNPTQVSFLHLIGQLYWEENKKEKAEPYFRAAYRLAKNKFPGTIPAMTKELRDEILKYLDEK